MCDACDKRIDNIIKKIKLLAKLEALKHEIEETQKEGANITEPETVSEITMVADGSQGVKRDDLEQMFAGIDRFIEEVNKGRQALLNTPPNKRPEVQQAIYAICIRKLTPEQMAAEGTNNNISEAVIFAIGGEGRMLELLANEAPKQFNRRMDAFLKGAKEQLDPNRLNKIEVENNNMPEDIDKTLN